MQYEFQSEANTAKNQKNTGGLSRYHESPKTARIILPDNNFASNNDQNMPIFWPHFTKVLVSIYSVDFSMIGDLDQLRFLHELGNDFF